MDALPIRATSLLRDPSVNLTLNPTFDLIEETTQRVDLIATRLKIKLVYSFILFFGYTFNRMFNLYH